MSKTELEKRQKIRELDDFGEIIAMKGRIEPKNRFEMDYLNDICYQQIMVDLGIDLIR